MSRQVDMTSWARNLDEASWSEAEQFCLRQRAVASARLWEVGLDLGGGGAYDLLYFLVRVLRPQTVVETGVAAGFSSSAILLALKRNGAGHLYSSDFPYFRLAEPGRYVGMLVADELRSRWTLRCDGDRNNLPWIVKQVETIDLFHYDSDKSIDGRNFALRTVQSKLGDNAVIIFDDIQDNRHFRDLMAQMNRPFLVFAFEGKWLGMVGGPNRFYS